MMKTLTGLLETHFALMSAVGKPPGGGGGESPSGVQNSVGGNIPKFDAAHNFNMVQKLVAGNQGA